MKFGPTTFQCACFRVRCRSLYALRRCCRACATAAPSACARRAETTPSYRKICITWVQSAKQQATNDKRMAQLVEDTAAGRLIPSQRYGEMPKWVERAAAAAKSGRSVREPPH